MSKDNNTSDNNTGNNNISESKEKTIKLEKNIEGILRVEDGVVKIDIEVDIDNEDEAFDLILKMIGEKRNTEDKD